MENSIQTHPICPMCEKPMENIARGWYCSKCNLTLPEKGIEKLKSKTDHYRIVAIFTDAKWRNACFMHAKDEDVFIAFILTPEIIEKIEEFAVDVFQFEWLCADGGLLIIFPEDVHMICKKLKDDIETKISKYGGDLSRYKEISIANMMLVGNGLSSG